MTELQKCQFEILTEIDRICKKHKIHYYLSCGSMLGAVRHKGFIPWDDDLDINMDADDYFRFLKVAPSELSDRFFLQSSDTDWWYKSAAKVRMNQTTMIEKAYERVPFHQGVWVDIFPMTAMKDDPKALKRFNFWLVFSDLILQDAFFRMTTPLPLKYKLVMVIPRKLRCRLASFIRKRIFKPIRQSELCDFYSGFPLDLPRFRSKDFEELIDVPFEDGMFPIPKEYDALLTRHYGDYMTPPPPEKRNGGHDITVLDLNNSYEKYLFPDKN